MEQQPGNGNPVNMNANPVPTEYLSNLKNHIPKMYKGKKVTNGQILAITIHYMDHLEKCVAALGESGKPLSATNGPPYFDFFDVTKEVLSASSDTGGVKLPEPLSRDRLASAIDTLQKLPVAKVLLSQCWQEFRRSDSPVAQPPAKKSRAKKPVKTKKQPTAPQNFQNPFPPFPENQYNPYVTQSSNFQNFPQSDQFPHHPHHFDSYTHMTPNVPGPQVQHPTPHPHLFHAPEHPQHPQFYNPCFAPHPQYDIRYTQAPEYNHHPHFYPYNQPSTSQPQQFIPVTQIPFSEPSNQSVLAHHNNLLEVNFGRLLGPTYFNPNKYPF